MTDSDHIPDSGLADLAEKRGTTEEQTRSMTHVFNCSACAGELHRLEQVLDLMRTDTGENAPRDVIAYALNIFREAKHSNQPSLLRRVVAALSFDSLSVAPAFGVRSGHSPSRQFLYSAAETDIDLRISQQEELWLVAGQVLGQGCAGGVVTLEGAAEPIAVRLNDQCEFILPLVLPGSYKLVLRLADIEVEIPQLELRS